MKRVGVVVLWVLLLLLCGQAASWAASAPTGVSVSGIGQDHATVTWTNGDATGTSWAYRLNGGAAVDFTTSSPTATTRELTGLEPDTSYVVELRELGDGTPEDPDSEWVAADAFTTDALPPAGAQVVELNTPQMSVLLMWACLSSIASAAVTVRALR